MRPRSKASLAVLTAAVLSLAAGGCRRGDEVNQNPAPALARTDPPVAARGEAPSSFAPIVKRVSPAVVSIDTVSVGRIQDPFGRDIPPGLIPGLSAPVQVGAGSGFIITGDGYIVTNNHVVRDAQEISVTLADGRQFPAKLVGRDPPTDIAVIKIDAKALPFVSFAKSALPEVGDWVVAVGNPYGLGGTATAGIVSAHGREIGEAYVSYIQIDAPINAGNSGGPSFDLQGRVIGVNTAIFSPNGGSIGIGFAIPADLAENISRQLIETGHVTRGYLGVTVRDLTPALANRLGIQAQRGALIVDVTAGGPAAGRLASGDAVTAVNGEQITSTGGLTRRIAGAKPGDALTLHVVRRGGASDITLKAARRPEGLGQ